MRTLPTRTLVLAGCLAVLAPCATATAASGNGWTRTSLRVRAEDDASRFEFEARYELKTKANRSKEWFRVKVWDAEPGAVLDVAVNGLFVGELLVNDAGNGGFRLRSENMPELLPDFMEGDFVTVGEFGGALDRFGQTRNRHKGKAHPTFLRLRDDTEDESGLEAHAKYMTWTRNDHLRRRFKVRVEGGAEGDVFPVVVNDEHLGDIVLDEWGEGKLDLRERDADTALFPMMGPGDVVHVGDAFELVLH